MGQTSELFLDYQNKFENLTFGTKKPVYKSKQVLNILKNKVTYFFTIFEVPTPFSEEAFKK